MRSDTTFSAVARSALTAFHSRGCGAPFQADRELGETYHNYRLLIIWKILSKVE
jgi:hypothetical protein